MLERLREEWELGENRFAMPGEGFFVAKRGELLVGVCGLNRDPYASRARVGRLRRLYVSSSHRRSGVARALVGEALSGARECFSIVRVRAGTSDADLFYRALGFKPLKTCETATHQWRTEGSIHR